MAPPLLLTHEATPHFAVDKILLPLSINTSGQGWIHNHFPHPPLPVKNAGDGQNAFYTAGMFTWTLCGFKFKRPVDSQTRSMRNGASVLQEVARLFHGEAACHPELLCRHMASLGLTADL